MSRVRFFVRGGLSHHEVIRDDGTSRVVVDTVPRPTRLHPQFDRDAHTIAWKRARALQAKERKAS